MLCWKCGLALSFPIDADLERQGRYMVMHFGQQKLTPPPPPPTCVCVPCVFVCMRVCVPCLCVYLLVRLLIFQSSQAKSGNNAAASEC